MGLAAPKNRMKLSHDPNNTKWTQDTQSFGHKIMASQGWTPGDHLGVKGAAHAELHTDANFSHIRVTIKDDNLGLGAKIGSGVGAGECTGLDAFQTLLGRLNGRDEQEMEKELKSREDLKRAIYAEQKWGTIRFVRGGLLVGDKIQTLIDDEKERVRKLNGEVSESSSSSSEEDSEEEEEDTPVVKEKKSKKRKLEDTQEVVPEIVAVKVKKSKKRKLEGEERVVKIKKSKKSKVESSSASDAEVTEALKDVKLSKKAKKSKKEAAVTSSDTETTEDDEARRLRRKEKKERKREKREKKEQAKEAKSKSKRDKKKDKLSSLESSKAGTPLIVDSGASGTSTPIMMQGRHAVRSRNIAQKRLANMDAASLNQIFMIKS